MKVEEAHRVEQRMKVRVLDQDRDMGLQSESASRRAISIKCQLTLTEQDDFYIIQRAVVKCIKYLRCRRINSSASISFAYGNHKKNGQKKYLNIHN